MGSVRRHEPKGTLFLDFRYQGKRCREYTTLEDTQANRRRLDRVLTQIEAHIAQGTFDYAARFGKALSPTVEPGSGTLPSAAMATPAAQGGAHAPASDEKPTPLFSDFTEQTSPAAAREAC